MRTLVIAAPGDCAPNRARRRSGSRSATTCSRSVDAADRRQPASRTTSTSASGARIASYLVGGRLEHRWITEETRMPMGRRRDLVELIRHGRAAAGGFCQPAAARSVRRAPAISAGAGMQNGWHTLCRCGTRARGRAAVGVRRRHRCWRRRRQRVRAAVGSWAQALRVSSTVRHRSAPACTSAEAAGGGRSPKGTSREPASARTSSSRSCGFTSTTCAAGRVSPGLAPRRAACTTRVGGRFDYEYRANAAREPFAVVAVTIKQAGHCSDVPRDARRRGRSSNLQANERTLLRGSGPALH